MDRNKIREFVKKAYPKRKIVEQVDEKTYAADTDAADVDVRGLSPGTWNKFGTSMEEPMGSRSSRSELRERFRPRKLTGSGPARTQGARGALDVSAHKAGKLSLERLVPEGAAADTEDAIDVLVDEDAGIIGESDSGPEKD
jgi:hypothetical protein